MAQCTRPDILFAMSTIAQKCSAPTRHDYLQAIRILLYLKSTPTLGICFAPGKFVLVCHVDAAHNCYIDAHGHYGYCFSLGELDGIFHAVSKKMKLVTLSSTESEYVAICEAIREAEWLIRLLSDIGFPLSSSVIVYEDNMSTIDQVHGHRRHQSTKHINPKFHYSGEVVESGRVKLVHKGTADMLADIFTKPLSHGPFLHLSTGLLNMG